MSRQGMLGWIALGCILLACGCAPVPGPVRHEPVVPPRAPEEVPAPRVPGEVPPREAPRAPARRPPGPGEGAARALAEEADRLKRGGDAPRAAATLERALRIAPEDALLWQDLASVRLEERKPAEAEQLARKSNRLGTGDIGLQARNWDIIGAARRMAGDEKGAREAEAQAAALRAPQR